MVKQSRVAGIIEVKVNGELLRAAGAFTWNLGEPKREAVVGSTGVDGFKETPQVAFIEGEIRYTAQTNVKAITQIVDATVTLRLANGHTIVQRNSWYAGEGTGSTEEGTFGVRFEGLSAETMRV